eukprot:2548813-Amphidinium_carterae.1
MHGSTQRHCSPKRFLRTHKHDVRVSENPASIRRSSEKPDTVLCAIFTHRAMCNATLQHKWQSTGSGDPTCLKVQRQYVATC